MDKIQPAFFQNGPRLQQIEEGEEESGSEEHEETKV